MALSLIFSFSFLLKYYNQQMAWTHHNLILASRVLFVHFGDVHILLNSLFPLSFFFRFLLNYLSLLHQWLSPLLYLDSFLSLTLKQICRFFKPYWSRENNVDIFGGLNICLVNTPSCICFCFVWRIWEFFKSIFLW